MKITNTIVAILAATFLGTLAILAYVSTNGGEINNIIYLIGTVLGAAFPATLTSSSLNQVKSNTNGTLSALMAKYDAAMNALAKAGITIEDDEEE